MSSPKRHVLISLLFILKCFSKSLVITISSTAITCGVVLQLKKYDSNTKVTLINNIPQEGIDTFNSIFFQFNSVYLPLTKKYNINTL